MDLPQGRDTFVAEIEIPNHQLSKGSYTLDLSLSQFDCSAVPFDYDFVRRVLSFEVRYFDSLYQIPFVGWQPRLGSVLAQGSFAKIL